MFHTIDIRSINGGVPGVIFSHGNYWKELRRFLLRNLRDFGFGKTSMEDLFQDEVTKLRQLLSQRCDEPINLVSVLLNFISFVLVRVAKEGLFKRAISH